MQEPTLAVMAAGMGSRFGGLKQIEPIDEQGHIIIDYSLYDAGKAGFRNIIFIIKHEIEKEFREKIGNRMEQFFDVQYVYQELDSLPEGFAVPVERKKPWGTGHAIACLRESVTGPFAVINADDYYGRKAFGLIYDFLKEERGPGEHAMVAYHLMNTLTEHGYVSRGVCNEENGFLKSVTERTHIEKRRSSAAYTEDGIQYISLPRDTIVSMNLWGFQQSIFETVQSCFVRFLKEQRKDVRTSEFYLPAVADALIREESGSIRVLQTDEAWYGVTYREDLDSVMAAVRKMKQKGIYPEKLWSGSIQGCNMQ